MLQIDASIGIDWGTHSSKWTWNWLAAGPGENPEARFKILYSDVCLEHDSKRIFLSDVAPLTGSECESSVKGRLIKNPHALFWASPQRCSRLTLGELVSFSLWFLIGEAYHDLCNTVGKEPSMLDIRFSLPNWVNIAEGAVGRAYYQQAAHVACHLFARDRAAWLKDPKPVREQWQSHVKNASEELGISDESKIDTDDPDGFRSMLQRHRNIGGDVSFQFVAESSAAGLAALRVAEADSDTMFLRKILVVDVGAGSTDIGYVIRSIPPKKVRANEGLCQLPPANTCQIAGEELTRRIIGIHRSRGANISFAEAELIKTVSEEKEWLTHPNVTDWIHSIAQHVRSYLQDVPDRRYLREVPGLQVLITGGSGVVPGLREAILSATADALRHRGLPAVVINATEPITLQIGGPAQKDANRLAVAFGAASSEFPRLTYVTKLDPPARSDTKVRADPPWTGWTGR